MSEPNEPAQSTDSPAQGDESARISIESPTSDAPAVVAEAAGQATSDGADASEAGDETQSESSDAAAGDGTSAPTEGTKKKRRRGKKSRKSDGAGAEGAAVGEKSADKEKSHKHSGADTHRAFHVGDQLRGRILEVGDAAVLVDLWGKEQAVIDRAEFAEAGATATPENPAPELAAGEVFDVFVVQDGARGGSVVVTLDMRRGERARAAVQHAFETNEAIAGLVTGVNRGGLEVDLSGMRAFCPSSQIDPRYPPPVAPRKLVLTRQTFKVTSIVDDGREAIVSRRSTVEAELRARAEEARGRIVIGSTVEGKVTSVREYGVFVDLDGIEGVIHVTELTHLRGLRPSEIVKVGDVIQAKVLKVTGGSQRPADDKEQPAAPAASESTDEGEGEAITAAEKAIEQHGEESEAAAAASEETAGDTEPVDAGSTETNPATEGTKKPPAKKDRKRVRPEVLTLPRVVLSRRAIEPDPWAEMDKRFPQGSVLVGKVVRMQPFGAFVELAPGIDGLLHVSELGDGKRLEHPNEVLKDGQTITVRVQRVDRGAHRIALGLLPDGVTEEQMRSAVVPKVNGVYKAHVVELENSGVVWAQIDGAIGKTGKGVIPPNESNQPRGTDMRRVYPVGTEVTVKVLEMDRGRLRLSIRAALHDEERQAYRAYQKQASAKTVGVSLADKLRAKFGTLPGGGGDKSQG